MKVVDIKVDHFFAIVINVEKAYHDECKVLESVNVFLSAYLLKDDKLLASDRELIKWLVQNCQRSLDDLNRTFNGRNTQFVQRINELLEKKLEMLYVNLPDAQMLQQLARLKITVNKLFIDLKEWANQVTSLSSFKVIFGENHFTSEQLHQDWQKQLDQVKVQLRQIRHYLLLSFESLRKDLSMEGNQSANGASVSLAEHRDAFADDDWANFSVQSNSSQQEPTTSFNEPPKSCTNKEAKLKSGEQVNSKKDERLNNSAREQSFAKQTSEQADGSRLDLLKAFARLKEENDLLNQTYLRQNEAIQKLRKLFETKIHELVDQNQTAYQQQQEATKKRLDELTSENSLLKQKVSSFESKAKEVVAPGISQAEIERDWKLLMDELAPTEPTATELYRDLCDELTSKNQEICDLNRQIEILKRQNLRLKHVWFKSSQLICGEVVKLLHGFKSFSDQVKQGVGVLSPADPKFDNQKLSANYLKTFMIIRRSVELLKHIYLQSLLGQVQ